jgi:hypothetical protein
VAFEGDGNLLAPVFFLSYARAWPSKTSKAIELRLFNDLSSHVGELLGCAVGEYPGFMEWSTADMADGVRLAPEVLAAAGTCHVFVPLISWGYMESKWCAMEWDAFSKRNVGHRPAASSASSGRKTAILPVIWSPTVADQLPPAVRELQFFRPQKLRDPGIVQRYLTEGVYGLLILNDEAAYQAVAWCLAQRIVDAYYAYHIESRTPTDPRQLRGSFRGDDA